MGLFMSKEERVRETAEINARVYSSECTQMFARVICSFLNDGNEHYQWLMGNSKERMYEIKVFTDGVVMKRIEVNQHRLRQTGTYDVDSEGWSFGASGFEDLPNAKYLEAFRSDLYDAIKLNCPNVRFVEYGTVMLAENVKKGW